MNKHVLLTQSSSSQNLSAAPHPPLTLFQRMIKSLKVKFDNTGFLKVKTNDGRKVTSRKYRELAKSSRDKGQVFFPAYMFSERPPSANQEILSARSTA